MLLLEGVSRRKKRERETCQLVVNKLQKVVTQDNTANKEIFEQTLLIEPSQSGKQLDDLRFGGRLHKEGKVSLYRKRMHAFKRANICSGLLNRS